MGLPLEGKGRGACPAGCRCGTGLDTRSRGVGTILSREIGAYLALSSLLSWASLGCLGKRALNIYLSTAFLVIRPPVLWLCSHEPLQTLSPTKYSFMFAIWVMRAIIKFA